MDQGDALVPHGFDVDWSLLEDDWGCGLDANYHPPSTPLYEYSDWAIPLPREYQEAPQFAADIVPLEPSASFHPWMLSTNDPFPILPEVTYPLPGTNGPEGFLFENPSWVNSTIAESITPHQDGHFFPAVEMASFVDIPNTLKVPLEAADGSTKAEESRSKHDSTVDLSTTCPKGKKRSTGPRLRCTQAGCKLTFPRPFELNRHVQNIHDRTVNVSCPVYGCHRISRPFGRLDKFKEHFRKHGSSDNLLCLVEGCSMGPFTLQSLAEHLPSQHLHEHSSTANLYEIMKIVSPDVLGGAVLFKVAAAQKRGMDICPTMSLGCNFRLSILEPYMARHIRNHELVDRAKSWDYIFEYMLANALGNPPLYFDDVLEDGAVTCSVCHWRCNSSFSFFKILNHIHDYHSKEERQRHAKELSDVFGPCLAKKASLPSEARKTLEKLGLELQEVGVVLPG